MAAPNFEVDLFPTRISCAMGLKPEIAEVEDSGSECEERESNIF